MNKKHTADKDTANKNKTPPALGYWVEGVLAATLADIIKIQSDLERVLAELNARR